MTCPCALKRVRIVCTNLDRWQADRRATGDKQTITWAERSPKVPNLGVNAVVRREGHGGTFGRNIGPCCGQELAEA